VHRPPRSHPGRDELSHSDDTGPYTLAVARIDIPEGPGGESAMVWSLRPEMAGMVDRMIKTAYQRSKLPAIEREVARMRIAQLNDCAAC